MDLSHVYNCVSAKYICSRFKRMRLIFASRVDMCIYTNTETFLFDLISRSPYGDYTTSAKLRRSELRCRRSEIPSDVKQCGFNPARFHTTGRNCRHFTWHCSNLAKCGPCTSTQFITSEHCHFNSSANPDTNAANCFNHRQCYFRR